jgi:hypothetical protein
MQLTQSLKEKDEILERTETINRENWQIYDIKKSELETKITGLESRYQSLQNELSLSQSERKIY